MSISLKQIQRVLAIQQLALKVLDKRISEDRALEYAQGFRPYEVINYRRIENVLRTDMEEREIVIERINKLKSR